MNINEEIEIYTKSNPKSFNLHNTGKKVMPGGDTRNSIYWDPFPLYLSKGNGSIITDLDGNERVDLRGCGSFGVKHRMPKKPEIPEQVKQFICLRDMCRLLSRLNICVYM